MFNATYFKYDGTSSSTYGLKIASINSNFVETTQVFSPNLTLSKGKRAKRFFHSGISYDEAPEYTFTVLSQDEITTSTRQSILRWLVGRNEFKKLELVGQTEYNGYWFNCVFTKVNMIYVGGILHGFELTAKFDSIYCYGNDVVREIELTTVNNEKLVTINNPVSGVQDSFIYPIIESNVAFEIVLKYIIVESNGKTNIIETTTRYMMDKTEEGVVIDGELKIIKSDKENAPNRFNKNWMKIYPNTQGEATVRLIDESKLTEEEKSTVKRINTTGGNKIKIRIPTYKLIGF